MGEGWANVSAREVAIDGEHALESRVGGARMLFALGPRYNPRTSRVDRTAAVLEALGTDISAIRWCEQIHGGLVASLGSEPGRPFRDVGSVGSCDALITAEAGVGLLVWTADCVPILIAGGGVIAAVHSGWRGTAADIVGKVVRRFEIEFGVPAENLSAALGPAVAGESYPVGAEVIGALATLRVEETRWRKGRHVDLRSLLTARLEALGLAARAIAVVGPCTVASERLASHRRDGALAGRQWSLVYRTE